MGKLEEYDKKVNMLEQEFVDALDNAEKNFQTVDSRVTSNQILFLTDLIALTSLFLFELRQNDQRRTA